MAGEWAPTTLGQLLRFANGKSSPERRDGSGYPVYGSNGVIGAADDFNAEGGTIVVGRVGSFCGSLRLSKQRCWVTDNAIRATAIGENDARFLFYLLKTLNLNHWRAGSGQPLLNQTILSDIPAHVPPPAEQHAIAHVLGDLDDKIDLNRRMSETLESIARAIFKSWFVDFDPVRSKAGGRDPGLPQHVADLFPSSFQPSELGPIPTGWKVRPLDQIARFLNGLALQKYPAVGDSALPVIKIAQLRSGNTEGADRASAELDDEYVVRDGDVLFSWSGSLECKLWSGGPGALNQHLFKVTSDVYPKWFYYFWIHQHLAEFRHIAAGKATTMGHIQRHHLTDALTVDPGAALLDLGARHLAPILALAESLSIESRTLSTLRDALVPKLMSGDVRVPLGAQVR